LIGFPRGLTPNGVRNAGLEVWKDFDDQFFQLPKEKMLQKIIEKKQYIINRLNADFQKVYFGKTLVRTLPLVCVCVGVV